MYVLCRTQRFTKSRICERGYFSIGDPAAIVWGPGHRWALEHISFVLPQTFICLLSYLIFLVCLCYNENFNAKFTYRDSTVVAVRLYIATKWSLGHRHRKVFSRGGIKGFFRGFPRGDQKCWNLVFIPRNWKYNLFCWKFRNPGGGQALQTSLPTPMA